MDLHPATSQSAPAPAPGARTSLGGLALIVLLGLVAAIPAAMVDEFSPTVVRRDAGTARETASTRSISVTLARAVRDLVGGSTVSAVAHCLGGSSAIEQEGTGVAPAEAGASPWSAPARPELLNIPPPAV